MAHIVVYLQRTPLGLHPASAVALCTARDIGSERGASVTAICPGDAGAFDRGIVSAAARFGADVVLFGGPAGLEHLQERLAPVHVLVPFTAEGIAVAEALRYGPPTPRWIERPGRFGLDAVSGIVAGTLPWHDLGANLEAEYEGDVEKVALPPWLSATPAPSEDAPRFVFASRDAIAYVAKGELDRSILERLRTMRAEPASSSSAEPPPAGTRLVLAAGAGPLPADLPPAGPHIRTVLLAGADGSFDPSWSAADWVLGGRVSDVLDHLLGGAWETARG